MTKALVNPVTTGLHPWHPQRPFGTTRHSSTASQPWLPGNGVKPVPEGYRTVTAGLCIKGADRALVFYQKAFGAQVVERANGPDGRIMHAEITIGDSIVFVADEFPDMPGACRAPETLKGATGGLYLYLPDVDAAFDRAVKAGAKVLMPVADMFWGDRFGQVQDPFGHVWSLATHTEDLTPEELSKRQQAYFTPAKAGR